jgi:hypothetical protein
MPLRTGLDHGRPSKVRWSRDEGGESGQIQLLAPYLIHRRTNRQRWWLRMATSDATRPMALFEPEPQLALLSTRYDGPIEWLRAGQALERVLLEATAHGVSTSLLNQVFEHEELRRELDDPLDRGTCPQAVIRFGYGPPVPPTPRRSLADVTMPDDQGAEER